MTRRLSKAPSTKEMHERLTRGVEALVTGESWKHMLKLKSNMHSYSWRNLVLVQAQRPGTTMVAGYNRWQELGRQVRYGSKAIYIYGPLKYKRDEAEVADGKGAEEIRGFKVVPVFALEDTDGAELPSFSPLTGAAPQDVWEALVTACDKRGYFVVMKSLGATDGATDPQAKKIYINLDRDPLHQVDTILHEVGHVELDHVADLAQYRLHRGRMEGEAESVAWTVGQALGIETSSTSFSYIASWSGGDIDLIRASAERVIRAAEVILAEMPGAEQAVDIEAPSMGVDIG